MSGSRSEVERGGRSSDWARLAAQVEWGLERVDALRILGEGSDAGAPGFGLALEEAMALQFARLGSLVLDLAHLWVLEERLGIPRRETEALDLLVRAGKLPLDRARRLRMLSEYRLCVSRDLSRQDRATWANGRLSPIVLEELALIQAWSKEVALGLGLRLP